MALTDLSTLVARVKTYVPYVQDPVVVDQLRLAARTFCEETWAWWETLTGITSTANQAEYTFDVPTGYDAIFLAITAVRVNGSTYPVSEDSYTFDPTGIFTFLSGIPLTSGQAIAPDVVFQPKDGCASLPDWLVDRWSRAFIEGALALLKAMPDQQWSDPKGAAQHQDKFEQQIMRAKWQRMTGRKNQNLSSRGTVFIRSTYTDW